MVLARCGKPGQEMVRAVATAIAALTLVLATTRLGGVIDWPWHWVTAPLWVSGLALIAGWLVFIAVIGAAILRREADFEAASKPSDDKNDRRSP
jgi:hypothetical protein